MRRSRAWLYILIVLSCSVAHAAEVPFLTGRVNDNAGLLSAQSRIDLEATLRQHEETTSNQIVVLTIASLQGEVLEQYALRVADTWKIGQKGKDNGVLLLVALQERQVRIEVGSGLEGDLPDITCGRIIRNDIVPRFKNGDYDAGIRAGVTSIISAIQESYQAGGEEEDMPLEFRIMAFSLFLAVVGLFTIVALFSSGFSSWFLFVFLIPFWWIFPSIALSPLAGKILFGLYIIGFIIGKILFRSHPGIKKWKSRISKGSGFLSGASSGFSGGSSGGFSGGGGGFSGGGASGSW